MNKYGTITSLIMSLFLIFIFNCISYAQSNGQNTRPIVELKEYVDSRFKELDKRIEIQFNQIRESTSLSLAQLDNRFQNTNEWRNTITDMITTFATKDALETKITQLNENIKSLELTRASLEGKASQDLVNINIIISVIALIIGLLSIIMRRMLFYNHKKDSI